MDIPLKIRDKTVGVLSFQKDDSGSADRPGVPDARVPGVSWTADEARLLERLVDQMGLALESARLYQDTQRTAARDRLLAEVVGRVRETLDVESVLRTLAYEVRQALDLPEVVVRLRSPTVEGLEVGRARPGGNGQGARGDGQESPGGDDEQ
jgi:GAF domain-containing protein